MFEKLLSSDGSPTRSGTTVPSACVVLTLDEVRHLLELVTIKSLCRRANVEKVDAGPKGAVIAFRDNRFANPAGLMGWIAREGSLAKVRPDQKVVVMRDWDDPAKRLKGTAALMIILARLAEEGEKAAA